MGRRKLLKSGVQSQSRRLGFSIGNCRINRLLYADDFVLLVSSEQGLQLRKIKLD